MKKSILIRLAIGVVFIGGALIYRYYIAEPKSVENIDVNIQVNENVNTEPEKIINLNIEPRDAIKSPQVITGQAPGSWFFEGSFPIEIIDDTGTVIKQSYVTAIGEWMTDDYVSFQAIVEFNNLMASDSQVGKIVFKKDNPSGLPENDDSFEVMVFLSDLVD